MNPQKEIPQKLAEKRNIAYFLEEKMAKEI